AVLSSKVRQSDIHFPVVEAVVTYSSAKSSDFRNYVGKSTSLLGSRTVLIDSYDTESPQRLIYLEVQIIDLQNVFLAKTTIKSDSAPIVHYDEEVSAMPTDATTNAMQ
ncbi:hypothetical protein WA026_021561, partial [Henosepilachna vigintioctopunctata]